MVMSNEIIDESSVKHHSLSSGGHILYTYSDLDKYMENAVNFISEGLVHNQHVIFFESKGRLSLVRKMLSDRGIPVNRLEDLIFVDAIEFYNINPNVSVGQVFQRIHSLFKPYLSENKPLRVWGNVYVNDVTILDVYECGCDEFITKHNTINVCAYDGHKTSAATMAHLLKVHNYYMTDEMIVPSSSYQKEPLSSPSIIEQINRERTEEDALIRSEQLSFAGQFAAGICHEIRNPLTTINGFFQLIKEDRANEKYYSVIEDELRRIEQITSELLLLAKPHSEHRETHNLLSLINNVKLLLDSQAVMKSVSILTDFKTEEILVECEDTKIKQVLINIVKNAIEVMDKGKIVIEAEKQMNQALLLIRDEGPGMPKNMLSKIGEPFFTTKENGNGLGLLICFNIIKNHNGTIQVESEEGKGTTFIVTLPLANVEI